MRQKVVTQNPAAASATVVAASQSPGAGAITLAAGAASIDTAVGGRIIGLTSGSDDHLITFTVTGIDANGVAATEAVTGASGAPGTSVTTKFYKSVSSITHTGSVAGTFTAGTVGTTLSTSSQMIPLNSYNRVPVEVSVQITGTINFSIKETFDKIMGGILLSDTVLPSAATLVTPTALSAKTANTVAPLDIGATGMVIVINSYSTGATLKANIITSNNVG